MKQTLAVLSLCLLSVGTVVRAQQVQPQQTPERPPVYSLHFLTVSGTHPRQTLWTVDGGHSNVAYKSLSDPSLLQWVGNLTKGSEIDYRSPWASLPDFGGALKVHGESFIPDAGMGGQLKAFEIYCHSRGILFCDRFPVL